jgi:uncharacterized protein YggE
MSEQPSTVLRLGVRAFSMVVVALSAAAYTYQYGRSVNQMSVRSFSVTVEGKADAIPDVAEFSANVLTDGGANVTEAQNRNTEKMNKVIAFAKAQGIESGDIKTEHYQVRPRYDNPNCFSGQACPAPQVIGYSVDQRVSVRVRDTQKLGGMLSGVVDQGANGVSGVSFVVDDVQKIKNDARTNAIAQGKK